jgi:hypothetical protein
MRALLGTAAFVLLGCFPARAQQFERNGGVGRELICDTPTQLERFIAFRNEGQDAEAALRSVNAEVHDPIACGIVVAAFTYGKAIVQLKLQGELVSIIEITIVAMSDGAAWMKVPETIQYAIVGNPGTEL